MYSVLIVDDEEPVLESYEFMLNAFSEGSGGMSPFSLAGKARTGYEALRLIHEKGPDLVFMDINIPGIDGLAVLEDVYKKYPRMICILSTAYERFDLARRAIPLGAFAYLVKPVSKTTFFSTLEKVLAKLRSLSPLDSEYSDPRLALFRRDIWTAMDEQRWSWYRETLALPSDYGFALMVEMDREMEIWGDRIAEALSHKYPCFFDLMQNRGLFLVSGDINSEAFRQKTVKLLEKLLGNLPGSLPSNAGWRFGLGGCYRGPELYHSCEEALAELTEKRQSADLWSDSGKKIALLRKEIGLAPAEETESLFAAIWEPLFLDDFNRAKIRMVSLFTLLIEDTFGCWSLKPREAIGRVLIDPIEIMELPDMAAWKRWAERNFGKLVLQAGLDRKGDYPLPLVKAISFINENYARGIQLSDAAEASQVNSAHLSRLFSKHLKTNFIDYLTALRINEAEALLREKAVTVKEAALATGYQDPNYFSKIFKKIKGILPTEVTKYS